VSTPGVTNSCHAHTPTRRPQLIGRKYFRQVIITWSIRSRGRDQRGHIITRISTVPLPSNTAVSSRFPQQKPHRSAGSNGRNPVCHPPRNKSAASPLTANMLPYSARKKYDHRIPLYSVWNPATNSLSASARSNVARLQLAVAVMKNRKKATNVNGSWNRFQFQNHPTCCRPISVRLSVPATHTGTTTHRDR